MLQLKIAKWIFHSWESLQVHSTSEWCIWWGFSMASKFNTNGWEGLHSETQLLAETTSLTERLLGVSSYSARVLQLWFLCCFHWHSIHSIVCWSIARLTLNRHSNCQWNSSNRPVFSNHVRVTKISSVWVARKPDEITNWLEPTLKFTDEKWVASRLSSLERLNVRQHPNVFVHVITVRTMPVILSECVDEHCVAYQFCWPYRSATMNQFNVRSLAKGHPQAWSTHGAE